MTTNWSIVSLLNWGQNKQWLSKSTKHISLTCTWITAEEQKKSSAKAALMQSIYKIYSETCCTRVWGPWAEVHASGLQESRHFKCYVGTSQQPTLLRLNRPVQPVKIKWHFHTNTAPHNRAKTTRHSLGNNLSSNCHGGYFRLLLKNDNKPEKRQMRRAQRSGVRKVHFLSD